MKNKKWKFSISENLNIYNMRTTSGKTIKLHIIRNLIKDWQVAIKTRTAGCRECKSYIYSEKPKKHLIFLVLDKKVIPLQD